MKSFKYFLAEKIKEEPFEHNPKIGWWNDGRKHITLYHGTHERNHDSIVKNGIDKKDPTTGMISLTADPHTAHGYASMSSAGGEAHFRAAKKKGKKSKAVSTPEENRVVYKLHVPIDWLHKHLDPNMRGNIGMAKGKLSDKASYDNHASQGKEDHEHYAMTEFRVNKEIPPHFIKAVMRKKPRSDTN